MAIVRYAGNRMTGVSGDTKPTSNLIAGTTFQETNTDDLYVWDGSSWNIVAGNTVAQTFSNKTLTSPVLNTGLSGTAFLDEDDFASDSATKAASQQSIKAYVASQVSGSQNVFSTVAVSGQDNVVADGTTDTLTLVAGSNMTITTTAGSDSVTFAAAGSSTVTVTDNESTNENNLIIFVADAATSTGAHDLEMDGDLHYNPSTGTLTSTVFVGALTGNASGTAATVTGAAQTAITSLGTLTALQVDNLNINANTISATSGALNITPAAGSAIVLDGTINVDAGVVTGATSITSTAFVGGLTGNVTGNASGTAATVTGAAQTAITSLGTLTALQVDNLNINGNTVSSTAGTDLLITPLAGQQIVLDGTIIIDAGVVTGATSITSTAFVGTIDGVVGGNTPAAITGTTIDANTDFTVGSTVITDDVVTFTPSTNDTVVLTAATNGSFSLVTTDAAAAAANIQITADGTVDIDSAGVLTLDSGAAINIEPAAGSAILLDGTISIDAGVVTGATSITSTAFVGDITGDVTGTADVATVATTVTITDNESTNENNAIIFTAGGDLDGGNLGLESDGDLHYNPSTGTVTATTFVGALTGNASGSSGSTTGNAATATALATGRTISASGDITWTSASFDGSGNVTSVAAITADSIINADVKSDAAIAVSKLAASTITIGGTSTTLGGTITALTALTDLDLTAGDKTLFDTVGNNTLTIGASTTTVNIAGDLTVGGDATTFNTATVSVEDPLMILASNNNAADAVDIGFYGLYDTSGSLDLYSGIFRDANDSGKWKLFKDLQAAPTTTVNTSGTGYAVGTFVANIEGNVTGDVTGDISGSSGSTTGNAATATEATNITAVANNSTNETVYPTFVDGATGTQGIETDTGFTYNPSTGVLTSTTFTGALSGNAATATALATARTIGGTSFDGSANIVPGTSTALATGRTIGMTGDITWTSASFDGSGNVTGTAAITSDVIVNADVKSDAAIAYSKLAALSDGNILVGNGSNVAVSVNPSGDVDISNAGVFSIAAGVIVNADVNASAAIVDTKLDTISTANKVSIAALDIDGASEIGAAIVDADVFIIDDGAGGTNRKVLASRVKTYVGGGVPNPFFFA